MVRRPEAHRSQPPPFKRVIALGVWISFCLGPRSCDGHLWWPVKREHKGDIPGSPGVKTSHFDCRGGGFNQGTKAPHAV